MMIQATREMTAMLRRRICGHVFWFFAQGGSPFRGGSAFVALNMAKVEASMPITISEHEKFTPRSSTFAIRTRVLTFCAVVSLGSRTTCTVVYSQCPWLAPFRCSARASPVFLLA